VSQLNNPMEVFKLLNHSNCRDCHKPTCLAFAAAVYQGQKRLDECPHLRADIIARFSDSPRRFNNIEEDRDAIVERLKEKIAAIDLAASARRLEAHFSGNKLTLKVLGKNFSVDSRGNLSSDIHIHSWVAIPVLNYLLEGAGLPASGQWIPFRELKNGKTWYRLFEQRCEKPIKRVADIYTDLFEDMIHIFNGRHVEDHYAADISLVLHPLPKVPILICYWKPEDGLDSSLNIFFDSTAEDNLNIESIYALGTGLARMFEKIALRHGLS